MRLFVTAKRGDTSDEPEHTLAAYEAAVAKGADAVGIAVRLSADGVPVVRRYAYLDDDTDRCGAVHAMSWAELSPAVVGPRGRPLSRLGDIADALDGRLDLDIRLASTEAELGPAVLTELRGCDLDRVQITGTHAAQLARLSVVNQDVIRCLLIGPGPSWAGPDLVVHDAIQRARLARADAVHLRPSQVTPETLNRLDDASLGVQVWGADDVVQVAAQHALGPSRFCTDRLDALLALRDAEPSEAVPR